MAQQPQASSQIVLGPAGNGGGDIIHYTSVNATAPNFIGWVDKNGATQGVSFVVNGLQQSPAATITAATGGVFSYTSNGLQVVANLPGGGAAEQIPFKVKAAGTISLGAGTYTATVQPLLYASTTVGYTAAAGNAIYSLAAVTVTFTNVAASVTPFKVELDLIGNTTSGTLVGSYSNYGLTTSTGTAVTPAAVGTTIIPAASAGNITSVSYSAAVPVQFAFGITLAGTASAAPVLNLGSFFIES